MLEEIRKSIEAGISAIPIGRVQPRAEGKEPLVPWRPFIEQLPTARELESWAALGSKITGLAWVLGPGTWGRHKYLWCLDIEKEYIEAARASLPPELFKGGRLAQSGGGGIHLWLLASKPVATRKTAWGEVRGAGSYTLVPPSVLASGGVYRWLFIEKPLKADPEELKLPAPPKLSGPAQGPADLSKIPVGARNDTLFREACRLRALGATADEIRRIIHALNLTFTDEPLPADEVEDILSRAAAYEPHRRGAETLARQLLRTVVLGNVPAQAVADVLGPEEFEALLGPGAARLFELALKGRAADAALDEAAASYLLGLEALPPLEPAGVRDAALVVTARARRRRLAQGLLELARGLDLGELDPGEAEAQAKELFAGARPPTEGLTWPEERGGLRPGTAGLIPTGFRCIDGAVGGVPAGGLFVIGARPEVGKTTLMEQMAEYIARHVGPALFVSREMTREALDAKAASRATGIPAYLILAGRLAPAQAEQVASALERLRTLPIVIMAQAPITTARIEQAARTVLARYGRLGAIFVDYIQILDDRGGPDEFDRVTRIVRALKALALSLGVPVVAASQLNRASEAQGRPPTLADLRSTGQIEQEADLVALLWRPDEDEWDKMRREAERNPDRAGSVFKGPWPGPHHLLLTLAKSRFAPVKPKEVLFVLQNYAFVEA